MRPGTRSSVAAAYRYVRRTGKIAVLRASTRPAMRFTIATYNIHKGFSHLKRRMVIHELREKLHGLDADIIFLQEVQGVHERHAGRYADWPGKPQHEFIADDVWQGVAYGKTVGLPARPPRQRGAVALPDRLHREPGHLGAPVREPRRCSTARSSLGARGPALHCMNVHLGLFERGRQWQIRALCERIRETVPHGRAADHRRRLQRLAAQGATARWSTSSASRRCSSPIRGRTARTFPVGAADVPARPDLRARPAASSTPACTTRFPGVACPTTRRSAPRFETIEARAMNRFIAGQPASTLLRSGSEYFPALLDAIDARAARDLARDLPLRRRRDRAPASPSALIARRAARRGGAA